jgi:hypothetical protein
MNLNQKFSTLFRLKFLRHYRAFQGDRSMKGYQKNEPGEYSGYEKSNRFKQLIYRAVVEEIISTCKAAALDNKKASRVSR